MRIGSAGAGRQLGTRPHGVVRGHIAAGFAAERTSSRSGAGCTLKVLQSFMPQSHAESLELGCRANIEALIGGREGVKNGPRCYIGLVSMHNIRQVDSTATRRHRAIGQIHATSAFFGLASVCCVQYVDV
jgi:hypothetical protein